MQITLGSSLVTFFLWLGGETKPFRTSVPIFCQVPPLMATVPRNPDGLRQIHRFPYFLVSDFSLSGQRLPVVAPKKRR